MRVAQEEVAGKMDVAEFGYPFSRIINNGPDAGQEVSHLHAMGGERMGMP